MKKKTIIKNSTILILFLGIIFLFFYLLKESYTSILYELSHTSYKVVLLLIFSFLCYETITAYKISEIAKQYNKQLKLKDCIIFRLESSFYSFISFGGGTWIYYFSYLKKKGFDASETIGIQAFQFITDKIAIFILEIVALFCLRDSIISSYGNYIQLLFLCICITILIIIGCMALCLSERFHHTLFKIIEKIIHKEKWITYIQSYSKELDDLRKEIRYLLKSKQFFLKTIALSMIRFSILYCIPFLIFQSNYSFWQCFILMGIIYPFYGLIPLPGGIGSFDFMYLVFFIPLIGQIKAASSLLLFRVPTFLLPIICGAILAGIHLLSRMRQRNE